MRVVLTVIGKDKVGIIAGVSGYLAEKEINITADSQIIKVFFINAKLLVKTILVRKSIENR